MNRIVKFRGKRVDNGEWVYGHGISQEPVCQIIYEKIGTVDFHVIVDPATVGQFTGLTDKNGKEIYEGDVVENRFKVIDAVTYNNGSFIWKELPICYDEDGIIETTKWAEVIGNIYENSNLLEK